MPEIHRVVENAGGAIVDDDLCTGRRFFDGALDTGDDPMAAIAARYADRVLCPSKHRGDDTRSRQLLSQVRESNADGVIFFLLKFCDPHGFDHPHLKEALHREGIPSLLLEVEDPAVFGGQAATRIEAFIENL
jgi:benzoyl-CoA reductase/2-hydroxyglutaryl-CoA dehydratase subunit BcrC/BadD/HgdB